MMIYVNIIGICNEMKLTELMNLVCLKFLGVVLTEAICPFITLQRTEDLLGKSSCQQHFLLNFGGDVISRKTIQFKSKGEDQERR